MYASMAAFSEQAPEEFRLDGVKPGLMEYVKVKFTFRPEAERGFSLGSVVGAPNSEFGPEEKLPAATRERLKKLVENLKKMRSEHGPPPPPPAGG
jgi:hypothetical protein